MRNRHAVSLLFTLLIVIRMQNLQSSVAMVFLQPEIGMQNTCLIVRESYTANSFGFLFTTYEMRVNATQNLPDLHCPNDCVMIGKNRKLFADLLYRPNRGPTVSMLTSDGVSKSSILADYTYDDHNESIEKPTISYGKRLKRKEFSKVNANTAMVEFECWMFVRRGFYAVRIMDQQNITLNKELKWKKFAEFYSNTKLLKPLTLWLRNDSIFPSCKDDFTISWRLPSTCNASKLRDVLDFRIRVFASATLHKNETQTAANLFRNIFGGAGKISKRRKRTSSSLYIEDDGIDSLDLNWLYMGEMVARWVNEDSALLSIPCAQFDIIHQAFCFELISLERQSHHLEQWNRKCVRTEPIETLTPTFTRHHATLNAKGISDDSRNRPKGWSVWSEWGHCFSDNLKSLKRYCDREVNERNATVGYRKRHRTCILSATSKHSHKIGCGSGSLVEFECCSLVNNKYSVIQNQYPQHNFKDCECGCDLSLLFGENSSNGAFFAEHKKCQSKTLTWLLLPKNAAESNLTTVRVCVHNYNKQTAARQLRIFKYTNSSAQRVLWSSENFFKKSAEISVELAANEKIVFNLTTMNNNYSLGGFYVDYQILKIRPYKDESQMNEQLLMSSNAISSLYLFIGAATSRLGIFEKYCNYSKYARSQEFLTNFEFDNQEQARCDRIMAVFAFLCAVLITAAVLVIPPHICICLSRCFVNMKHTKMKKEKISDANAQESLISTSSKRAPGMLQSGETNSTRTHTTSCTQSAQFKGVSSRETSDLSDNSRKIVSKRSIGIQLSRQPTPQLPLCNTDFNNNNKNKNSGNINNKLQNENSTRKQSKKKENLASPNLNQAFLVSNEPTIIDDFEESDCCAGSGADALEYDYYEPPHPPSSFLKAYWPQNALDQQHFDLISDINIDEIVCEQAQSITKWLTAGKWSKDQRIFATQDAQTQISRMI